MAVQNVMVRLGGRGQQSSNCHRPWRTWANIGREARPASANKLTSPGSLAIRWSSRSIASKAAGICRSAAPITGHESSLSSGFRTIAARVRVVLDRIAKELRRFSGLSKACPRDRAGFVCQGYWLSVHAEGRRTASVDAFTGRVHDTSCRPGRGRPSAVAAFPSPLETFPSGCRRAGIRPCPRVR